MQQQNPQKVEASKVPEYIKKAAKKAAEFNSNFNRERMEERRAYFDLQTHVCLRPTACVRWFHMLRDSLKVGRVWSSFSDHPGPPGEIQGAGPGADQDGTLPGSSDTRTVPGVLQKVCNTLRPRPPGRVFRSPWTASYFRCIRRYTPNELRYLPLNTALYEPPLDPDLPALDSEPDSDDAEDGKEEKKNKNSSVRRTSLP